MVVEFLGDVTSQIRRWFVVRRGCRRIIKLINKRDPEITGAYSDNVFVPTDSVNFDNHFDRH